jgi:hypothetical protein
MSYSTHERIISIENTKINYHRYIDKVWLADTNVILTAVKNKRLKGIYEYLNCQFYGKEFEAVALLLQPRLINVIRFPDSVRLMNQMRFEKHYALQALSIYGNAIDHLSRELQMDPDCIRAAIEQSGTAIRRVNPALITPELVQLAQSTWAPSGDTVGALWVPVPEPATLEEAREQVSTNGESIRWMPKNMLDDKELVIAAIKKWPWAFLFAESLQSHSQVIKVAKGKGKRGETIVNRRNICKHPDPMQIDWTDEKNALELLQLDPNALFYAPEWYKTSKAIALDVVKKNGFAIYALSEELQNDMDIIKRAIEYHHVGIMKGLKLNKNRDAVLQFLKQCVMIKPLPYSYSSVYMQMDWAGFNDDKEILMLRLIFSPDTVKLSDRLKAELRDNEEIVVTALKTSDSAMNHASKRIQELFKGLTRDEILENYESWGKLNHVELLSI